MANSNAGYYVMQWGKSRFFVSAGFPAAHYPSWVPADWIALNSSESGATIPTQEFVL